MMEPAAKQAAMKRTHLCWKEFFKDPPRWTHFQHDIVASPGLDSLPNHPPWACQELSRRSAMAKDGFLCSLKQKNEKSFERDGELVDKVYRKDGKVRVKHVNRGAKEEEIPEDKEAIAYVALLKACARKKDVLKGSSLHGDVVKKGFLQKNPYLGSALIHMYSKCGHLDKAQQVLDELIVRDVVSWSALISGYAQQGEGQEALNCLERMQNEGLSPDSVTFVCSLKACGSIGAIDRGKEIHKEMANKGLPGKDVVLGTALVDMYAKCGELEKAEEILKELPCRNVVSWNALISGYIEQGQGNAALGCFDQMQIDRILPNVVTFTCMLKACGSIRGIEKGKLLHEKIAHEGLLYKHIMLGNALVDMYSKCGMLEKAQQVHDELPVRNVVSWNALIAGYTQEGDGEGALNCFERMQKDGLGPDVITFSSVLKACGILKAVDKGKRIHDEIISQDLLQDDIVLGNGLIDMYVKCGDLSRAHKVLNGLRVRDIVSWSSVIAGYAEQGLCEDALDCLEQMQIDGFSPNAITLVCILKACGSTGAIDKGTRIHDEIVTRGLLGKHLVLGNALVDMYAKCGQIEKARKTFFSLPVRDVVSWNALITGYVQQGWDTEALKCFKQMQRDNISPDMITYVNMLKACGAMKDINMGRELHREIMIKNLLKKDISLGTALVDMYAKCGELTKAYAVFNELPFRNVVSWNALITGYAKQGQGERALQCFEQMRRDNLSPDAITFLGVLKACGSKGAVDKGIEIHDEITSIESLKKNIDLGNALVDMYAKCGQLEKAQEVFNELLVRDVVSWNVLISGYGQEGEGGKALFYFEKMQCDGVSPDAVTLLCVLSACSHSGMVEEGRKCFADITEKHGFAPDIQHKTCMVDLFSRAGLFDNAMKMIKEMAVIDYPLWCCVLDACQRWGNVQLGRLAFEEAIQLDTNDAAAYISMASIYMAAGLQEEAKKIEAMRMRNCVCHTAT